MFDTQSPDRPESNRAARIGAQLQGKSIAVTGAGQGLGAAYAAACAAQGALVTINDIDADAALGTRDRIAAAGGSARVHIGSISSWEVAREFIALAATGGRVDGVVVNAAINHESLPWLDTEDSIRSITEVNVLGAQFVGIHAMRAMLNTGGSIVAVTSGARFGIANLSAYGVTKGAVSAMAASWAVEGRVYKIRVNAVSPLAHTRMSARDLRPNRPELAQPEQIAPLVVALLGDATSGVTGRTFRFDGETLAEYDDASLTVLRKGGSGQMLSDPTAIAAHLTR